MWLVVGAAFAQDPPPVAPPEEVVHDVLLWQGFRHFWERHAAAGLHVPHRVSRFESRVSADAGAASFTFAQDTGVDGDWMFPEGYVGRLSAPDLDVRTGVEVMRTTESVVEGEHPKALTRFQPILRIPKRDDAPVTAVAVLQGLSFSSWCEGEEDCGSNGIWPYRFQVVLAPCQDHGDELACPLTVEVGRAWTPSKGGLRGFEVKPLEQRMGMEVQVAWAVLVAPPDAMLGMSWVYENALPSTREMILEPQVVRMDGLPTGYPTAAVAYTGLAFEFLPPSRRETRMERGRYIGGWGAQIAVDAYDPETGTLAVRHAGGIWLPSTVHRTAVTVEVDAELLLLAHPDSTATPLVTARGALCSPSNGAPWFSRWNRCEQEVGVEERHEQTVTVPLEPR